MSTTAKECWPGHVFNVIQQVSYCLLTSSDVTSAYASMDSNVFYFKYSDSEYDPRQHFIYFNHFYVNFLKDS